MKETEETPSDRAHFPSDSCKNIVPAEISSNMSMPSSRSGISTETYSVSQNENRRAGEREARSEKLVEGQNPWLQFTSDSSEELDVERNDVGDLQPSISNGQDVGPSTTDGQDVGPSYSDFRGNDEGPSISTHPDSRSQRSRDRHEMSTYAGAHYSDRNSGFVFHPGSSSSHPAHLWRRDSSTAFPITLFLIAPKSVEDVAIRPQKAHRYGGKSYEFVPKYFQL